MKIFDTHAHYDDEAFDEDREELLQKLPAEGILRVVNVGASLRGCEQTVALAEKYDYIYAAVGVHPCDTKELTEESFQWLAKQCLHEKCVAVGEIGLDYYWEEDAKEKERQKKWFVRQLDLARSLHKPVVIHSRDAARDTLELCKENRLDEIGGVVHCYSYSREMAAEYLDMGMYFGIGGVVTFKNSRKLVEVVDYLPMDRIVLETDSPYLSPVPFRGKRNSSLNLPYVAKMIAEIKGISVEEVCGRTFENGLKLYGMGKKEG